jgi:hypothetical protein
VGINLYWDEAQPNILVMSFDSQWVSSHYHEALTQMLQMMQKQQGTCHVIVDATQMKIYSSALMLNHAQTGVQQVSHHSGGTVVITQNTLVEALVRTTSALYPTLNHRLYTARDYASALKILERYEQRQRRNAESYSTD